MKSPNQLFSKMFDEDVAPFVVERYGANDIVAISEEFNIWKDYLNRDCMISDESAKEFYYVGKYSENRV